MEFLRKYVYDRIGEKYFKRANLYPINSVAGDLTLAQGTPSYEGRTYWIQIKAVF